MKTQSDQADFRATGLFLSGFQSIAEPTYIPLKPLTLLYGPNSAGKSSVIDAIELFENIANRQRSQVWEKVDRWQHRNIDDDGNWPSPSASISILRVGVQFTIPSNWAEHLDREVKEYKMSFDDQPHLERLNALVGRTIHIDIGVRSKEFPFAIRVAIDHSPVFESRFGNLDDGIYSFYDASFKRENDPDYDVTSAYDDNVSYGPLRIYDQHDFWKSDRRIAKIVEFSSSNTDPETGSFVRTEDGCLKIYDIEFNWNRWDTTDIQLYRFEIEHGIVETFHRDVVKRPKMTHGSPVVENQDATAVVPKKMWPRLKRRPWDISELEEILDELGVFCNALLQIGSASLGRIHVSGSRQILNPADMTFRENEFKEVSGNHAGPTPSYVTFASCLAYDETRNKALKRKIGFYGMYPPRDHRVVNRWLEAMLPSLRGSTLRSDAYISTPLAKKRASFGEVDDYVYRLYLVDAQGRPHEFNDVGSGFSYLFPILVALWAGTWSIVEQPELHLHPAAQCDVADVFIAAKNLGHAALIESHSENLLLRILRRIRETTEGRVKDATLKIEPDDVAVLYFDPQADGTTKVKQLRISRDGDFIDRWPAGFFEERSRELFGE